MSNQNRKWKIGGIIATLLIILAPPIYLYKEKFRGQAPRPGFIASTAFFTGSGRCQDCHQQEYARWDKSHHKMAMAVASPETVLGDFNNATFNFNGAVSRFYQKEGRYFVETPGPEGKMGEYEITHTFGWHPLQQYLVPFPGGRLQCLPLAWDVEKKKWFHLYPNDPPKPGEWHYWTNSGQNWNGMCAECHITNMTKNYDPEKDEFKTEWTELTVGCESCHGPGSVHEAWAQMPAMGRPKIDNYGLTVRTSNIGARRLVEICAPCHARRASLEDNKHDYKDFMDYAVPQLLTRGMYYADGQILEEVYVYGSFVQSKMYDRDVRCSDCHDVHSLKRVKDGNELCLQCHRAELYDTPKHHFHKKAGEQGEPIRSENGEILFDVGTGAQCEQCHMPGKYYMVADYRPDHSFRRPRPDLTAAMGMPNACNRCHKDKPVSWSMEYMTKWYGTQYRPHYGSVISAGRDGLPEAKDDLLRLFNDSLLPTIVRATILSLLNQYIGKDVDEVYKRALTEEEPLIRQAAVRNWVSADSEAHLKHMLPLLRDPVKAVRIETAWRLSSAPKERLTPRQQQDLEKELNEYRKAMLYTAHFAQSRHNLGNLDLALGNFEKAERHYLKAVDIDPGFYPAKVNLAMLYNQTGRNDKAEKVFKDIVRFHPDLHEAYYSLGLLLAERKKYKEALEYLEQASERMPHRDRVHYNLGQLQIFMKKTAAAEESLMKALRLQPESRDYLLAVVDFYIKQRNLPKAVHYARELVIKHPDWPVGRRILKRLTGSSSP